MNKHELTTTDANVAEKTCSAIQALHNISVHVYKCMTT